MKITQARLPEQSLTRKLHAINYTDCYQCIVEHFNEMTTPDDILVRFWTDMPPWINALFNLRNRLVRIVGLKTDNTSSTDDIENAIRHKAPHSILSVTDKSGEETIVSLQDTHLTAYLSVRIEHEPQSHRIYCATLVSFHRPLGYIYFYAIYPFHHLIVKNMLKHTLSASIKKT